MTPESGCAPRLLGTISIHQTPLEQTQRAKRVERFILGLVFVAGEVLIQTDRYSTVQYIQYIREVKERKDECSSNDLQL